MNEVELKDYRRRYLRECSKCHKSRIAGQAFTNYICKGCQRRSSHPNTAVPAYCKACCEKDGICCRCGGRMD